MNDRFGSELQYEMILHLSTLNLLYEYVLSHSTTLQQHQQTSLGSNNSSSSSYTTINNSLNSSVNDLQQEFNLKFLQYA